MAEVLYALAALILATGASVALVIAACQGRVNVRGQVSAHIGLGQSARADAAGADDPVSHAP